MEMPESMDECFYFTRRSLDNGGNAVAWVLKPDCPECSKAKMGKPVEKGKVKIRAKEYACPECGYNVSKEEFEPTLTMNVQYKCPYCGNEGEATTDYKRKNFKGVPSYVFRCGQCGGEIGLTKKMKATKK
ncbi:hypothetical protein GF323_00515 [Candidatus Woesearchaeota archaeon]|nr:hypothetical protein [Candidatus Woesearchaeota archaeon]